jgi:hypothetical protein
MSEALRALELLGAPATQRRTIERVCGSEFFQYIQTVERVPGASGDGTDPTAEQPPMVRVDFIRDMPRSRFDGGFWEAASPEQDGGDPSDN